MYLFYTATSLHTLKKPEEYLSYCFESPDNVLQYIVDLVYCIEIPYSTDSRDMGCHTLQYSLPGGQTKRGMSFWTQHCYFANTRYF